MPINRPTTKTIISTTGWGIPITDEVNRLTPLVNADVPTAWTNLTLLNGWTHYSGQPGQYRKVGDMVQLRGRLATGVINASAFIMPVGYRAPYSLVLATAMESTGSAWGAGIVDFRADGNFIPFVPSTLVGCSLTGLQWSVTV